MDASFKIHVLWFLGLYKQDSRSPAQLLCTTLLVATLLIANKEHRTKILTACLTKDF
jgi:hypothetical protein